MTDIQTRRKLHRDWMRRDRAAHPEKYKEIDRKRRPQVRAYLRKRYHSDPEFRARIKAHSRNSHSRKREKLDKIKDRPCLDCGVQYPPWVMEFDHVNGDKKFTVSRIYQQSFKNIEKEIKKCELVCANCHRIRTHSRWLDLRRKKDTVA